MRKITLQTLLFFFNALTIFPSHAAKTSVEVRNKSIPVISKNLDLKEQGAYEQSYGLDLNYESNPLKNYMGLVPSIGVTVNVPDYSHYKIRGLDKQERVLSSYVKNEKEVMASGNLAYSKDVSALSFAMFGHVDNYPFRRRGISGGYSHFFNEKLTEVGVKGLYFWQRQPAGFYLDGAKLKPKATMVKGKKISTFIQQVMPWDSKLRFEVFTGQRQGERPVQYGGIIKGWKAINDQLYLKLEGTLIKEVGEVSFDGRGIFSLTGSSVQLTYEPVIGFFITGMYGLSVEKEEMKLKGTYAQHGVDQFGLGMMFETSKTKYHFKWSSLSASNGESQRNFSGGISWDV